MACGNTPDGNYSVTLGSGVKTEDITVRAIAKSKEPGWLSTSKVWGLFVGYCSRALPNLTDAKSKAKKNLKTMQEDQSM